TATSPRLDIDVVDFAAHPESIQTKNASKKRKRFEKFVERQEKKKEHARLLEKLADSSLSNPPTSTLTSAPPPPVISMKLLGRGNLSLSKKEREDSMQALGAAANGDVSAIGGKKARNRRGMKAIATDSHTDSDDGSDSEMNDDELDSVASDQESDVTNRRESTNHHPHNGILPSPKQVEVHVFSGATTSVSSFLDGGAAVSSVRAVNPAKMEFGSGLRKISTPTTNYSSAATTSGSSTDKGNAASPDPSRPSVFSGLVFGGALKRKNPSDIVPVKDKALTWAASQVADNSRKRRKVDVAEDTDDIPDSADEDESESGGISEAEETESGQGSESEHDDVGSGSDSEDMESTRSSDDKGGDSKMDSVSAPPAAPIPLPPPTAPTEPPPPVPVVQSYPVTPANLATSLYLTPITTRPVHIVESRASDPLPIAAHESTIYHCILHNPVTVIVAETGSGKTTQVPQMVLEYGFGDAKHPLFPGMVLVTEPRRVAARSVAQRVREEMGCDLASEGSKEGGGNMWKDAVGWAVRYERGGGEEGQGLRLKFVTEGVLLRELAVATSTNGSSNGGDPLLEKYSCIILDETHTRTTATDVLLGWLTRIASLRNHPKALEQGIKPLRLVVMSATMDVAGLVENQRLFGRSVGGRKPPVVNVDGRRFKVTVHYNRRTPIGGAGEKGYLQEAMDKVVKIHEKLPAGGILVFVTGRKEVEWLCRKLREKYGRKGMGSGEDVKSQKPPTVATAGLDGAADEGEDGDESESDYVGELERSRIPKRARSAASDGDDLDDYVDDDHDSESEEEDVEEIEGDSGDENENVPATTVREDKRDGEWLGFYARAL
ncbi:ATP-dependent RNA helicase dhx37, partial [Gonapodya sp. JEL0774]